MKYYQNPTSKEVFGYDETDSSQLPYMQIAIDNGYTDITGSWPPPPIPSDQQAIAECRGNAQMLLVQTDWTELPSVGNPANTPYLTNVSEFAVYRSALRVLAVNPVVDPVWPTIPTEVWS